VLVSDLSAETDGSVRFHYGVENAGEEPRQLTFRDGGHADCVVLDGDGDERWRWSADRMFTQAIERETLAPGDRREFEFEWETPVAGEFTARAVLRAVDADCAAETTFSVEAVE
jgi:hypothetical protein